MRWLLEQFEFAFERRLSAGARRRQPAREVRRARSSPTAPFRETGRRRGGDGRSAASRRRRRSRRSNALASGRVTPDKTVPQLKQFAEAGGTIVAFGSRPSLGQHLGLPRERSPRRDAADGTEKPLPATKFYVPGSVLERRGRQHQSARVRHRQDSSTCSSTTARCSSWRRTRRCAGVKPVAWFDYAGRRCAPAGRGARTTWRAARRPSRRSVGKGKLLLFGPEITFRAQPHGTFKFLFNGIYYSTAEASGTSGRTSAPQ